MAETGRSRTCRVCGSTLLGEQIRDWGEFCSEVCWDSMDADFAREVESGKFDDLLSDDAGSQTPA